MLSVLLLLGCGGEAEPPPVTRDTGTAPRLKLEITTQGEPDWQVALIELFQAPVDPSTAQCLFEGPHQSLGGTWVPGDPHEGPYDQELLDGISRCGFNVAVDDEFSVEEWSDPNGVWLGAVITAPNGGLQGSTPDYSLGDLIQDNRFPLVFDADVRRDGIIVDRDHDGSFPPAYDLGFFVNGHSHVVLAFGSNLTRMPAGASAPGAYTWNLSLRDATSANLGDQGFDIVLPFTVVE